MEPTTTHVTDLAYAADLIKCAQVTTDYQDIACKLAGPLVDIVRRIFPGHLLALYLLTDVNRRQVWNAYLSSPRIAHLSNALTDEDLAELRVRLLICRSHALVVDGYGSSERGLIGLYGKLGPQALPPEFYVLFHATLTQNELLRRSLCHAPSLDPKAFSLLFILPHELQSYRFARELIRRSEHQKFLELHQHLQRAEFPDKEALMPRLYRAASTGREFRGVLAEIRLVLPFPDQVVPNEGLLQFIRNGTEMIKAAERFRNCLERLVPDAFSGDSQFYEWRCPTPAIICLKRHRGTTWYIDALSLEDNETPSEALDREIRSHFARYGIGQPCCLADLFDTFLCRSGDLTEEIELLRAMDRGG